MYSVTVECRQRGCQSWRRFTLTSTHTDNRQTGRKLALPAFSHAVDFVPVLNKRLAWSQATMAKLTSSFFTRKIQSPNGSMCFGSMHDTQCDLIGRVGFRFEKWKSLSTPFHNTLTQSKSPPCDSIIMLFVPYRMNSLWLHRRIQYKLRVRDFPLRRAIHRQWEFWNVTYAQDVSGVRRAFLTRKWEMSQIQQLTSKHSLHHVSEWRVTSEKRLILFVTGFLNFGFCSTFPPPSRSTMPCSVCVCVCVCVSSCDFSFRRPGRGRNEWSNFEDAREASGKANNKSNFISFLGPFQRILTWGTQFSKLLPQDNLN